MSLEPGFSVCKDAFSYRIALRFQQRMNWNYGSEWNVSLCFYLSYK